MYVILPNPPKLFFKSPLGNFGKVIEFQLYTWLLNVRFDQNHYLFIATLKSFSWVEYLYPLAFKCSSQWYASKFLKEINHRVSFLVTLASASFNFLKGPLGIKMVFSYLMSPLLLQLSEEAFSKKGWNVTWEDTRLLSFLRCNGCHSDSLTHFPKVKVFNYKSFHWFLSHRN